MSEAPFLYHPPQAINFILDFSFFSARHHVQKESILTSYQKQTLGMLTLLCGLNITMQLQYTISSNERYFKRYFNSAVDT